MYFRVPKRFQLAVLYTRTDPDEPLSYSAADQEKICRKYCTDNGIPISHVVHVNCNARTSLDVMRYLLKTLPEAVDTLFACRFFCYSTRLPELAELCMLYQCRPLWVQSLEIPTPLFFQLHMIQSQRIDQADAMYQALLNSK